jgi:hypothetical protein
MNPDRTLPGQITAQAIVNGSFGEGSHYRNTAGKTPTF